MISTENHIQILYEIALQVGEGNDLHHAASRSLLAYLRKLNCSAGAILQRKTAERGTYFETLHTLPRRLDSKPAYGVLQDFLPLQPTTAAQYSDLPSLPWTSTLKGGSEHLYLLELPNFGLLFMIKRGAPLPDDLLYTLQPLNKKLADALNSFLLKEQMHVQSEALQASSSAIFICDQEGLVEWVNHAWCKLNGYSEDEVLGQSIAVLSDEQQQDLIYRALWDLRIQRKPWSGKIDSIRKDGSRYMAEWSITPVTDGTGKVVRLIGIGQDISERVAAEERLRQSEVRLNEIVQSIPDIMWMQNTEGIIRVCNREFCEWAGIAQAHVIGKKPEDILSSDHLNWLHAQNSALTADKPFVQFEQAWDKPSGERLFFDTIKTRIAGEGVNDYAILGLSRNISLRKAAEAELIQAKDTAERAEKAQFNFLSTMSHEIRTPLNAVVGLANILLMGKPRKDQIEHLKTLKFSSQNLLNIINDILDYNKMAAGKIALEQCDFNLEELIRGVKFTFGEQARRKGIELRFSVDPEVPEIIVGDSTRLLQIMNNLVSNALKFTEEGFVELRAVQERITDSHVRLHIAVKDSGIGIPADKHESIFEEFLQTDSSVTRKYGGTGLGLSIVRKLLHAMDSEIHVDSAPGMGTEFSFEIRFRIGKRERVKSLFDQPDIDDSLAGKRILLVEDNPVNQMIARKFLEDWQCLVHIAHNGQEALEQLNAVKIDLVLMDLQMPVMDGYKATGLIRAHEKPAIRDLPVVALSASALGEIETRARKFGMNAFVTKPFQPERLFAVLKRLLVD